MGLNKSIHPLSNHEINSALRGINGFSGVYMIDELKNKKIKNKEFLVINLDFSGGPGNHWVACASLPDKKHTYYFDSYGLVPPKLIQTFLESSGRRVLYSNSWIQGFQSILCGYYAIYFIKELALEKRSFYELIYKLDQFPSKSNKSLISKQF